MVDTAWTYTEISEGRLSVSNGDITIIVRPDFSGEVSSEMGDFFAFNDLRVFIDGAKMLERVLIDKYGSYK